MTAIEFERGLLPKVHMQTLGYDVVHNGLIVARVVVNHDDRTIELVTE